ncbi:MAG: SDR family oxidoreductase [Candidatus Aminicenantes bacterium]|nr:SDR family oxidoreductase [Candidatus Aminicenantes bacterium]
MSLYLVTGGAGFIGSNIVEELLKRKNSVRVLDNFLTGKKENLTLFLDKIDLIEGDIRDIKTCHDAVRGVDYVLHQAALPSVPLSLQDPISTTDININGTLNILIASRDAQVKKLVFASSSSVYGDEPSLPKKEGKEGKPLSPYAASKLSCEKYCQVFSSAFGLPIIILRYFNVFGPRQDPRSQYAAVIPQFISSMLKGQQPVIYGDGEQTRDFSYVSNIVAANILAANIEGLAGEVFNLACGEKTSVNDLVKEINSILRTEIKPIYAPPRPGDIRHSYADISRAVHSLDYHPLVNFERGIIDTIKWYEKQEEK